MTIAAGTRLGSYEILAKLGEREMGEVDRARDTILNRDVALKLPSASGFSAYPLFERGPWLDRVRQSTEYVQFMAELKATTERYRREFGS